MLYDAHAFLHRDDLITLEVGEFRRHPTRPKDLNHVDSGALSQPEVQAGILSGLITHAALSLIIENQISRRELDPSPHTITIRLRSDKKNLQPVIGVAAVVAEQLGRLAVVVHENVEVPIIVEIGD